MKKQTVYMSALVFGAGAAFGTLITARVDAAGSSAAYETSLGGGDPNKVLMENDKLRVTLISFQKGSKREGGFKRRADQLIVYLEPGDFKTGGGRTGGAREPNPGVGKPVTCDAVKDCGPIGPDGNLESQSASGKPLAVGTVAFHPKDTMTGALEINNSYRALYIELKK